MTKKANYTFAKHFHGGENDFHLLSSFSRHNKSADSFMHNADVAAMCSQPECRLSEITI